ncbi:MULTISPECIES: NADP-dependent oxidoreductase [Pseudomonas syringae group]|uniref:NADP-dependent oxidoreductase n=1 Tax=Pseudomonas syringae group TaxID=136849 RepID=UPI000F069DFE|nr:MULTISPECIES: NADP-dependent oxidoreductase [Pseudomonas]MCQ2996491.1 NADP-dependent oxidoreductase [Pseudomonas syringae]MCD5974711.1 NADP-dependent oxidoreductase [Pseudomonas quasicaspiana]MCD5978047.1 NADP-dependent oxidoreductase [Pseudomonas quasicaspiana]MCD5991477.1 NADP-dependent oxidoreductase [Pseudomonas quasicaspiana]MDU8362365.1 NADP-dependent oxidoreductase [Pseudomonas syringae group sp. J309-1]
MTQELILNQRIVLASRPTGAPTPENFRLEREALPDLQEGQVQLRTLYLSLDPYMRGRMSDAPSYADPVEIDAVMEGGAVSIVEQSRNPAFKVGDRVVGQTGWQTHSINDGAALKVIPKDLPSDSMAVGVLGMPGMTAYMGLMDIGKPQAGETLVVAAASGAVGSVVGQVAKLQGLRVVGVAGGAEKCRYVVDELGFDACIDHKSDNFAEELKQACGKGIDIYFELVGGKVFDAVLPLLNPRARIPVCGVIAQYNAQGVPEGPNDLPLLLRTMLTKRARMQGFIVFEEYGDRHEEFFREMTPLVTQGKIKFREDVVQGLEQAPEAFIGLLEGRNFGKLVVHVSDA